MTKRISSFDDESSVKKSPVFGIDLGTTNSAISVVASGSQPQTITLNSGKMTMPSCVMYKDGQVIVGDEAYNNRDKENVVYSVKRLMQDTDAKVIVKDGDTTFDLTPEEVSAEILKGLVEKAGNFYGEIKDVVVTVPAYFNQHGVNATRKACELAGLNLISISNEPTAASLCYDLNPEECSSKDIIVYDLGGGTFDLTIIRIDGGGDSTQNALDFYGIDDESTERSVSVLGIAGDMRLGGDDVDEETLKILLTRIEEKGFDTSKFTKEYRENLKLRVEKFKKSSVTASYVCDIDTIDSDGKIVQCKVQLYPEDFEAAAMVIFNKTQKIMRELLANTKHHAKSIVLVGGSTKNPYIKEGLRQAYPSFNLDEALSPDLSVSQGAAIQGKVVKYGDLNTSIFDILPIPICVWEKDRLSRFIDSGVSLPVVRTIAFDTVEDGQECISVNMYQGHSSFKEECAFLGKLTIDGIEKKKAGEQRILVTISISADRLLCCKATVDGVSKEIQLSLAGETGATQKTDKQSKKVKRFQRFAKKLPEKQKQELLSMIERLGQGVTEEEIDQFIASNREELWCASE